MLGGLDMHILIILISYIPRNVRGITKACIMPVFKLVSNLKFRILGLR